MPRTSSLVFSKSDATFQMHSAMTSMSSVVKPRVVTAGVPIRTPLVMKGLWGSLGMAFLLAVM